MRLIAALVLALSTGVASAVSIDGIPGYDFAATANRVSSVGAMNTNLVSAIDALTDLDASTYAFSRDNPAIIDMSFGNETGDVDITNGNGVDLSLFFVMAGGHELDVGLYHDNDHLGTLTFNSIAYTGYCIDTDNSGACESGSPVDMPINVMNIDFASYGNIGDVDTVRLDISDASAVPSLAGAYYQASSAVIPIPAPLVLFASGMALLGTFVRRSRKH